MPRPIKAYACEYRCGHNVLTKRLAMVKHELRCFRNPDRRSCVTCVHDGEDSAGDGRDWHGWRTCEIDARPEGKECIVECEHHKIASERHSQSCEGALESVA